MTRRREDRIPLVEILFAVLVFGMVAAAAIPPMVYSGDERSSECRANVEWLNARTRHWAERHEGQLPADHEEFQRMLAEDRDNSVCRMPRCPYGEPYVYDPAAGRVLPHRH